MRRLLPLLLAALLAGCSEAPEPPFRQQLLALGTLVDVMIAGVDEERGAEAVERVRRELETIHHDWHAWQPSRLTEINAALARGESITLDDEGRRLIATGIELSLASGHLFDPAAGALIAAWGFHSDQRDDGPPPDPARIEALVAAQPRMSDLRLEENRLSTTNPAVQLDLGGYAKGYAVDRAIEALRAMGIENAIVNAGGDLRAIGDKYGKPWRIGIRDPRGPGVIAALRVEGDESVFTSGDYERFFTYRGRRYHHIIDPRSGYPAEGNRSVTVVHGDATTTDAAATALLIAGAGWPAVARAMGVEQVMVVTPQGEIQLTPPLARRIELMVAPGTPVEQVELP